jgi:hypothetical protein
MFCPEFKFKQGYLEVSVGEPTIYCISIYRDIRKTAYFQIKTRNGQLQQEIEGTVFNAEHRTDKEVMDYVVHHNRFLNNIPENMIVYGNPVIETSASA